MSPYAKGCKRYCPKIQQLDIYLFNLGLDFFFCMNFYQVKNAKVVMNYSLVLGWDILGSVDLEALW